MDTQTPAADTATSTVDTALIDNLTVKPDPGAKPSAADPAAAPRKWEDEQVTKTVGGKAITKPLSEWVALAEQAVATDPAQTDTFRKVDQAMRTATNPKATPAERKAAESFLKATYGSEEPADEADALEDEGVEMPADLRQKIETMERHDLERQEDVFEAAVETGITAHPSISLYLKDGETREGRLAFFAAHIKDEALSLMQKWKDQGGRYSPKWLPAAVAEVMKDGAPQLKKILSEAKRTIGTPIQPGRFPHAASETGLHNYRVGQDRPKNNGDPKVLSATLLHDLIAAAAETE